ncbi:N-acetyltransferase [archaeon]|nr:MAG: N-acetyltransferase [archaeon]
MDQTYTLVGKPVKIDESSHNGVNFSVYESLANTTKSYQRQLFIEEPSSICLGDLSRCWELVGRPMNIDAEIEQRRKFLKSHVYVIAKCEDVVGGLWFDEGRLSHIGVDPRYRRQGVGSKILELGEKHAGNRISFIWDNSNSERYDENMRFFKERGYNIFLYNGGAVAVKMFGTPL